MFRRVAQFHHAFGCLNATVPGLPEAPIRNLRPSLLAEELNEFREAHAAQDIVEMADGLADMCYIIAGTLLSYGLVSTEEEFHSPYADDMTIPSLTSIDLSETLQAQFDHYLQAEAADDLHAVDVALRQMLHDVCTVAFILAVPLDAVFAEVHRSNMSKLLPDGSVLRREDGKVMKPEGWTPPDIAGVLGLHTEG